MKDAAPWLIIGLLLLISLGIDCANTAQGGAIDLRNRVTGLRLLEHGLDAYHYKWTLGDPEEYCDVYNNPKLPVSKTTATPALLMLHLPIAALPYRAGEFVWLALQWALLLGTGALYWRGCTSERQRLFVAIAVTAFTYTAAWRLHAERGQAYVLLAFVFGAWLVLSLERKQEFAAGCIAGFLIALRPTFALLVPFLAWHRRGQLVGAVIGALLGLVLPLLINSASWNDYFAAMQTHSELYRDGIDPRPGPQHYPPMVEGMPTDTLGNYAVIPYADFSLTALLKALGLEQSPLTKEAMPAWPLLALLALAFGFWLWVSRMQSTERLLVGMAAWIFLADLFVPAYRDSYNDVLILDVVLPALALAGKFPGAAWPCVMAVPMGLAVYIWAPEDDWLINTPTALFTATAIGFLVMPFVVADRTDMTTRIHRTAAKA